MHYKSSAGAGSGVLRTKHGGRPKDPGGRVALASLLSLWNYGV